MDRRYLVAYVRFQQTFDGTVRYRRTSLGREDRILYQGIRVRDAVLDYLSQLDPADVYPIRETEPGQQAHREVVIYHREHPECTTNPSENETGLTPSANLSTV